MSADGPLQAVAVHLPDVGRHLQRKPATGGGGDDGARQDMRRYLVERGGEPQQLIRVHPAARRDDVGQPRSPLGQRAGLVKEHHPPSGQAFQGAAALDDDADARGAGQAGHDRDRGREQQRARRRDHQHRDGANGVLAERPGRCREDERERDKQDGEPVGGADERRRRGLRLLNQAHHPGVGGLRGRRRRDKLDRLARVDHAAADVLAGDSLRRPRLPRQRGLIQHGRAEQPPVHRDDPSRAHQQPVTGDDVVDRDLHDAALDTAPGRARGPLGQQAQLAPRPRGRPRLQELPAGEHHRDHSAGERLADHQRAGQREHRDDVNARLVAPDRAGYPGHRKDKAQHGPGDPQDPRGRPGSQQPRHAARQQQHAGHGEQRHLLALTQPGHALILSPAVPAQWSCHGDGMEVAVPPAWRRRYAKQSRVS